VQEQGQGQEHEGVNDHGAMERSHNDAAALAGGNMDPMMCAEGEFGGVLAHDYLIDGNHMMMMLESTEMNGHEVVVKEDAGKVHI